jgi:hypothetical protein
MREKKGQASIELIILVTIALVLLAGFTLIQFIQTKDIISAKKRIGAEDIAFKLKTELSLAGRVDPDYTRTFELPNDIAGKDYTIIFGENEVSVNVEITGQPSSHPKLLPVKIFQVNGDNAPFPAEGVIIPEGHRTITIRKVGNNNILIGTS